MKAVNNAHVTKTNVFFQNAAMLLLRGFRAQRGSARKRGFLGYFVVFCADFWMLKKSAARIFEN